MARITGLYSMKIDRFALLALLTFVAAAPAFANATFTPTGVIDMLPTSMSDDASVVVGTGPFQVPNLYYTKASGVSIIGDGCFNGLPSISGDGSTVLGCHVNSDGNENAAKWLGGTSWQDLGSEDGAVPCGTSLSGPYGVNQNGTIGVGLLWRAQVCHANAGTWDLINGGPATVLPSVIVGPATRANAVNADGSVMVGWQDQLTGERTAAKWVNRVPELITNDDGSLNGEAQAVSADGATIVGGGYQLGHQAWIWREGVGVSPIGMRPNGAVPGTVTALDVSDNGNVVVGFVRNGPSTRAFFWKDGRGTTFLDKFLRTHGAIVPDGWTLNVASLISTDGNTIYGWGFNPDGLIEMFKAELNLPAQGPVR
jgi:uncharacterized membrane protein